MLHNDMGDTIAMTEPETYQQARLSCPYCSKECSSPSGLTLHKKSCKERPRPEQKETDIDPQLSVEEFEFTDDDNVGNVMDNDRKARPMEHKPKQSPKRPADILDFGAFLVFGDKVPMMLDIDFAITLGEYILQHGSKNSALIAFAHQLKNLEGESE